MCVCVYERDRQTETERQRETKEHAQRKTEIFIMASSYLCRKLSVIGPS